MSHILIADDDQLLTKVYSKAFEQAGYRISTANGGHKTTETLLAEKPDLVLLDLLLPDLDGIGVLKFIRSRPELEDLPVFIVSNSTYFSGIVQSAWNEGATKFIRKGEFSPKGLVEEVRKSLPPGKATPSPSAGADAGAGTDTAAESVLPTQSPSPTRKAKAAAQGNRDPFVLIADDDRTIHSVLNYLLSKAGHRIESAFNGLQAIEMARQEAPQLMILDVTMPFKDGFETLSEWTADPYLKDIPVIMLTSSHSEENEAKALGGGVTHYLTKPFSPASLVELVNQAIAN